MRHTYFYYQIEVSLEITGRDLALLRHLSARHYDQRCKSAFTVGGFGWGWICYFLDFDNHETVAVLDLDKLTPEVAARTHLLLAEFRELDTCAKILEGHALYGAANKPLAEEVETLYANIHTTLQAMNAERRRLNESTT
jgi:hypothetical protein